MAKITYVTKDKTGTDGATNKWRDADANEVKSSVNSAIDGGTVQTLTDATTINWDISLGQCAAVTLGANRVFANPTNTVDGGVYILEIIQDSTGSRTITSWGSNFVWAGGSAPTLTTTASKRDFITLHCKNGGKLYATTTLNFV